MRIKFTTEDNPLFITWYPGNFDNPGVSISGEFVSQFQEEAPLIEGTGEPSRWDPGNLPKLAPLPSRKIVSSVLGGKVELGGTDYAPNVVSLDIMRPISGETQGTISLVSQSPQLLDPGKNSNLSPGSPVYVELDFSGLPIPLLTGFIVEPPKFRIGDSGAGFLDVRVGDLFLLKRQSDNVALEAYCGPLPKTTATAAQIFSRVRGIPGTWGGEALVEGVSPDFVDGPPFDFLQSLYEVLNYDVRSTVTGELVAVPRPRWNRDQALVITENQAIEASLDSPAQLPFSQVIGYNSFERDLGFRTRTTEDTDFSNWDPSNTEPWFQSGNSYRVIKSRYLGDTLIGETVETWGYLPNNTIIPRDSIPQGETGPCGEFIPPPELEPVTTRLDILETLNTQIYFEPHSSGGFVVTGEESVTEGWTEFTNSNGDTQIQFGPISSTRKSYAHFASPVPRICPQYYPLYRVRTEETRWDQVKKENQTNPVYQLTQRRIETWVRDTQQLTEGQVFEWTKTTNTQSYDASQDRWNGGTSPQEKGNPPQAQFIKSLKVPVTLETEVRLPEFAQVIGERRSKPIQFPNAYTERELAIAAERFLRETGGLAYSVHLILDPRVPVRPGALVRYQRGDGSEIHGIVWSQEFNVTGKTGTQSIVLMRTFTEPALFALSRSEGFVPDSQVDYENPCQ